MFETLPRYEPTTTVVNEPNAVIIKELIVFRLLVYGLSGFILPKTTIH
jgi:hypothetical protein